MNITDHEHQQLLTVPANAALLESHLEIPEGAQGIVVFSYDRDRQQESAHLDYLANALRQTGLATFLIDLLTPEEEVSELYTRHYRHNVGLLADRLVDATDWLARNSVTQHLKIGYFGTHTGGTAALIAAAERPRLVNAVVCQSVQTELAGSVLYQIKAPTLLIAGGHEPLILDMNQYAMTQMLAEKRLEIIPGSAYSCEDLLILERVATLASDWFQTHLLADSPT